MEEVNIELAEAFQSLFHGRIDVWGSVEGRCNKELVTISRYTRHIKGLESLGIYPLLDNGNCYFFAIDIDEKDFNKAKVIRGEFFSNNLPVYIAESKRKGYHIYGFLSEDFPAKDVRRIVHYILNKLNIKAEVFPKQDKVDKVTPYGNYINLPCFSFTRPFLSIDLKEVPLEIAVNKIKRITHDSINQLLKLIPEEKVPPKEKPPREKTKKHSPCIEEILQGVVEPGRDEAAFALARYYVAQNYLPDEISGLLKLWNQRNKPPLDNERLLEIKVKSAEKGYAFGCKSITDNVMLSKFCVGVEECEWLKKVKRPEGITIDGTTYYQKDNQIFSSRPGKKEDSFPTITTLTNFTIESRLKIELEGEDERLDAIVKTILEQYPVLFKKGDFNSKRQLLSALPMVDLQYYGTDKDTQPILTLINKEDLPKRRGTQVLGRNGDLWVVRDMVISKDGVIKDPGLIYVPTEVGIDRQINYTPPKTNDTPNFGNIIELLLKLNKRNIILPILGWFFVTPFVPLIRERLGHFPLLSLWGTKGSGKSSILELLWKLFGVNPPLYSAINTRFSFLRLFSATSSIPIILDEYKPYTMRDADISTLLYLLKGVYDGKIETRGRPDLRLIPFRLQSPIVIAGEETPASSESALMERIIQVNLSKDTLMEDKSYSNTFGQLRAIEKQGFAFSYIKWCLGNNINEFISSAKNILPERLTRIPQRIYDNIWIMITGLVALREFYKVYNIGKGEPLLTDNETFNEGINNSIDELTVELLGEKGSQPTGLTVFLETLSTLAQTGRIKYGIHYATGEYGTRLYIHLGDCLAEFRKFVRETNARIEMLDKKAYLKQADEEQRQGGYVIDTLAQKWFPAYEEGEGKNRRCIEIDMSKLPFEDTSGFIKPGLKPQIDMKV